MTKWEQLAVWPSAPATRTRLTHAAGALGTQTARLAATAWISALVTLWCTSLLERSSTTPLAVGVPGTTRKRRLPVSCCHAHLCFQKSWTGCAVAVGLCKKRAPLLWCDSYHFVITSRRVRAVAVGPFPASPPRLTPVYCGCLARIHGLFLMPWMVLMSERQPLWVRCLCRGREFAWCGEVVKWILRVSINTPLCLRVSQR